MRLQQITCGHFTADDGTIQEMPNNRIDELLDLLYEVEGKVVIWAQFQRDVHNIMARISIKNMVRALLCRLLRSYTTRKKTREYKKIPGP